MEKDSQSRKWLLTINNPEKHDVTHESLREALESMPLVYSCMCDEIGDNGTYHTHVFLQGKSPIRFSRIKKLFLSAHIDIANGTAQQNRDYIRKEGKWAKDKKKETNLPETFEEFGECPEERPGRRTDLDSLYEQIKDGMTNFEILEANPKYMMHMDKVEKARQIVLEAEYREKFRNLTVRYIWGATGTGKTRGVYERHGYPNVYRITDYDHPWDGYRQQDIVVFEEFRSSLRIQDMLSYLDGHPLELPCRYVNKIACYTRVYILTNVPLEDQYRQVQIEQPLTWGAFLRRISVTTELKPIKTALPDHALPAKIQMALSDELKQKLGI